MSVTIHYIDHKLFYPLIKANWSILPQRRDQTMATPSKGEMIHHSWLQNWTHQAVGDGEEDGAENGDEAAQHEAGDEPFDPGGPAQGRRVEGLGDDASLLLIVGAVGLVVASQSSFEFIHGHESESQGC